MTDLREDIIEAQRDELLAALERVVNDWDGPKQPPFTREEVEAANAPTA